MNPLQEQQLHLHRREFFGRGAMGLGTAALASLLTRDGAAAESGGRSFPPLAGLPHFAPKAKRVIYLTQSGAPSQLDLYDHKPGLASMRGKDLPASVQMGQRLTTMTAGKRQQIQPSQFKFERRGQSGAWVSELLPNIAKIADDLCFVTTMHTEAINHAPGMTFILTGSQQPARPSMGAWLSYGLGSEADDLPAYVVMMSRDRHHTCGQLLYDYYWGSGFLSSKHQGVKFRTSGEPVLFLTNPPGVGADVRRDVLDGLARMNALKLAEFGDPEIATRIAQYEMAYKMQSSVPELADLADEPAHILDMYGPDAKKPGTYAANCIMARRLAERGVRFIQLFHVGWDTHGSLPEQIKLQSEDVDQASAALVADLKQRGMLDDTLVIWGGEFGRTVFSQGDLNSPKYGRDHHPRCFTLWMAGGGVRAGTTYGQTDDFSYNIVRDPVHVHDFQATVLHLLGIDHTKLTFRFQGRQFRLTDVHGRVVEGVLA